MGVQLLNTLYLCSRFCRVCANSRDTAGPPGSPAKRMCLSRVKALRPPSVYSTGRHTLSGRVQPATAIRPPTVSLSAATHRFRPSHGIRR